MVAVVTTWPAARRVTNMKQMLAVISLAVVLVFLETAPAAAAVVSALQQQAESGSASTDGLTITNVAGAFANLGAVVILGGVAREFMRRRIVINDPDATQQRVELLVTQHAELNSQLVALLEEERRRSDRYERMLNAKLGLADDSTDNT